MGGVHERGCYAAAWQGLYSGAAIDKHLNGLNIVGSGQPKQRGFARYGVIETDLIGQVS